MMKKYRTLLSTAALVFAAGAASADNMKCGTEYTVVAGDYLTRIAKKVYGDTSKFTYIYSANSDVIGSDPSNIQIGQRFKIPCLDEPIKASMANAAAITDKTTTAVIAPPVDQSKIRILSASGWAPYLDEEQEQGGMLTEIVNLAMENSPGKPSYKIDFVNDDGAHINPLLVDHAYDLSIGWYKPNCEDKSSLKDESLFRCNNLIYSDPIFEDLLGYYTLASTPMMQDYEELRGKSICRPEGFSVSVLEKVGMAEPAVTVVRAPSAGDCIDYVIDGKADVALLSADAAEARIAQLDDRSVVQLNEKLNYVDILYTIIAKTHPRADQILADLNGGIKEIKDSGVWFQTVRRHMTEFRKKNASE